MRAIQIVGPGVVEDNVVDDPEPGEDEVLIEVRSVGICGTDRRFADRGPAVQPTVPGHEISGLIDGEAVGVHPDIGCGTCRHCKEGFENRCPDRTSIGLDRDGGLAELVSVPANHVIPLDGVPPTLAPMLEPLACALHAVELLQPEPDEAAMVIGAGPMGILAMWALQAIGALVLVVQRSGERRIQAEALGADAICGPDDDPGTVLGTPPRTAIVAAPTKDALDLALKTVAIGGRVHGFAGIPGESDVDANVVHYRHLTLLGSTGSRLHDYTRARDLVAGGLIPLQRMPVTRRKLDDAPSLLAEAGDADFKTLIDIEGRDLS